MLFQWQCTPALSPGESTCLASRQRLVAQIFQSAVSPICNRQTVATAEILRASERLQVENHLCPARELLGFMQL